AEGLVGAAPARVAVEVDGRRPERQRAVVARGRADVVLGHAPQRLVQLAADLVRDGRGLLVDERRIPGHRRGLVRWETGGVHSAARPAVVRIRTEGVDAVLALAPIGVLLY